ncbi:NAD(P)H-dependent oxidoreductase [Bacillus sp. JCM 19041]|uniref:NAD(P)H-dependent oxidoreductase n=1 Tax=Bacillus sp. JCM 19041 TaxID=1460637 RepID=UPI0006D24932
MKKLLLIDGHDRFKRAPGHLTTFMSDLIKEVSTAKFEIQETKIIDGYEVEEEIKKFQWADLVIVQTPIYWFSLPGVLKKYMDDVFIPDVFFKKSNEFGRGGLLTQKDYMLSVSWGAKENAFNGSKADFLEGHSEDDVLFPVHKTFEYCGMRRRPTFSIYSAMKNPSLTESATRFQAHFTTHLI